MKRLSLCFLATAFLFSIFHNFTKAEELVNVYLEGKIRESNSHSTSIEYYNLVSLACRGANSIFKSILLPASFLILHPMPTNLSIQKGSGVIIRLTCEENDIESPDHLSKLLLKSLSEIDLADKRIVKIITNPTKLIIRIRGKIVDTPYEDLTSIWYDSFELLQTEPLFEPFIFLFNIEYPMPVNWEKILPDSIITVTLVYNWKKIRLAELSTVLTTKLLLDINLSDTQRVKIIKPAKK